MLYVLPYSRRPLAPRQPEPRRPCKVACGCDVVTATSGPRPGGASGYH